MRVDGSMRFLPFVTDVRRPGFPALHHHRTQEIPGAGPQIRTLSCANLAAKLRGLEGAPHART
ncbi:hypothetical protein Cco03nite_23270 [Catellatospora coxensis]|uniref:Uncharacterized protein n=1 Tax=Catellatospora coxensis TaxID=310354 RepID=A0A8J3P6K9_9ACTN|nr:hypothetical protein Cco03nite_23270 [Catellatospora coxensis]